MSERQSSGQSSQSTIVVPLDGSALAERAIPYAAALAGGEGPLVFLRVMPDGEPERSLMGEVETSADQVESSEQSEAATMLRESATRWQSVLNGEPTVEVAHGDAAEEILAVAERIGAGFIVMASHGRGAVGRLAFGSVADRVARATEVPVLIVRPGDESDAPIEPVTIRRLVVPYDGSPTAAEALPIAASLAARLGVPVHLLYAINPSSLVIPSPMGTNPYSGEIYTQIEDELTTAAKASLDEASTQMGGSGVTVTTGIVEGPPTLAIEDSSETGDLIVMTSHGRSGVRRWLLGSTAEKLVRTGPSPVLLVPAAARRGATRR